MERPSLPHGLSPIPGWRAPPLAVRTAGGRAARRAPGHSSCAHRRAAKLGASPNQFDYLGPTPPRCAVGPSEAEAGKHGSQTARRCGRRRRGTRVARHHLKCGLSCWRAPAPAASHRRPARPRECRARRPSRRTCGVTQARDWGARRRRRKDFENIAARNLADVSVPDRGEDMQGEGLLGLAPRPVSDLRITLDESAAILRTRARAPAAFR